MRNKIKYNFLHIKSILILNNRTKKQIIKHYIFNVTTCLLKFDANEPSEN